MLTEVFDFFNNMIQIISIPGEYLGDAAKALNDFRHDDNIMTSYLGYIHYAMGTPLYLVFGSAALIGIAVNMFKIVTTGIEKFRNICGM